jgi:hypothetical protein
MLSLGTRQRVKSLLDEHHRITTVAQLADVSISSVKRIAKEPDIRHFEDAAERKRRRIGRPSTVQSFRKIVADILRREPRTKTVDVLHQIRLRGYSGGKTALYSIVASMRLELARTGTRSRHISDLANAAAPQASQRENARDRAS